MLVVDTDFDELRDVMEVVQDGYLEIRDCLANGVVPGDMALAEDDEGNGIEDPSKIAGRVRDRFHAMREHKRLINSVPSEPAEQATE